jgi:hypothetical protein
LFGALIQCNAHQPAELCTDNDLKVFVYVLGSFYDTIAAPLERLCFTATCLFYIYAMAHLGNFVDFAAENP